MRIGTEFQAVVPSLEATPRNATPPSVCCCVCPHCCVPLPHTLAACDGTGRTPGSVLVWVPCERLSEEDSKLWGEGGRG